MKIKKTHKTFGGRTHFAEHVSDVTQSTMHFSTFIPDGTVKGCLIWLSGLTCTEENFISKAGAQRALAKAGLMVICPDTSPRGLHIPGEHESSDFGSGAGFYVDATTPGFRDHYKMYRYITEELYDLVQKEFGVGDRISLFGHSMGGHGALVIGLREPQKFRSISAFSPIVNPMNCPWGQTALTGYLGHERKAWKDYDTCALLETGLHHADMILIDQGLADPFLETQLHTSRIVAAAKTGGQKLNYRQHEGYDHSYYFIASFIDDHVKFHAEYMA